MKITTANDEDFTLRWESQLSTDPDRQSNIIGLVNQHLILEFLCLQYECVKFNPRGKGGEKGRLNEKVQETKAKWMEEEGLKTSWTWTHARM